MKKVIFFVLGVVMASYCFGEYIGRVRSNTVKANWTGRKSSSTLKGEKGEEWIVYYSGAGVYFISAPERATFFEMTDFSQVQYPFWIKQVKNIFYNDGSWVTDQFRFKIYADDGQTLLYESANLTAQNHPSETIHNLGADSVKIESGDFWLSVLPGDVPSGSPCCISDDASQGHSFWDSAGIWTISSLGEYARYAYVAWTSVNNDVCVFSIEAPSGGVYVGTSYDVKATAKNTGFGTETFKVGCIITDHLGTPVYADSQTVSNLVPGATQPLTFTANWTPLLYDESYAVTFATSLAGDMVPGNDTLSQVSQSYEYGEIAHDDFGNEGSWTVGSPNGPNDAFAVSFTPYITPPFYVTKGKVYVNSTTALEYIGLFPGSTTAPNMSSPYQKILNPSASSTPEWIVVDFDTNLTQITTSDNLWLVAKFAESADGPGIGGDQTPPIDNMSYWSNDLSAWSGTGGLDDFMLRIVHGPAYGTEETSAKSTFKVNYPSNPIQDVGLILYELPAKTNVSIELYDVTGRVVKTIDKGIRDKGKHELTLNTKELSSGIYFCKFEAGKESKTKKLILLK